MNNLYDSHILPGNAKKGLLEAVCIFYICLE